MNKIIVILAGAVLVYYLYRWYNTRKTTKTYSLPIDNQGVIVEPNELVYATTFNDIQGLI